MGTGTIRLVPTGKRPSLTLSAAAETPQDVRKFVNSIGTHLAVVSGEHLALQAKGDVSELRDKRRHARGARRVRITRRLRALDRLLAARPMPSQIVLGPRPGAPKPKRWADRVVDALPGAFPARPSPVLAGLAGLALAGSLVALTLWLRGRRD